MMKQVTPSKKSAKSFQGQSSDVFSPRKALAGTTKPRAIKSPGSRTGLKKGAGG